MMTSVKFLHPPARWQSGVCGGTCDIGIKNAVAELARNLHFTWIEQAGGRRRANNKYLSISFTFQQFRYIYSLDSNATF